MERSNAPHDDQVLPYSGPTASGLVIASIYNASDLAGNEQLLGRWSRKLARHSSTLLRVGMLYVLSMWDVTPGADH